MLFSFVACGDSECNHEFDNVCDRDCNKKGCSFTREVEHQFEYDCQSICSVEGCNYKRATTHAYDDACDLICNVCNEIRINGEHYCFRSIDSCDCIAFNKSDFESALLSLIIENGDFIPNEDERNELVLRHIYSAIADSVGNSEDIRENDGKPDIRDVVYYNYFATATVNGVARVFYTGRMRDSGSSIQIGSSDEGSLLYEIESLFNSPDFKLSGRDSYQAATTGTAYEGDVAFVSYSLHRMVGGSDLIESTSLNNVMVRIGKAPENGEAATSLESYLSGKQIGTLMDKIELTDGESTYVYSSIKINFVASRIYGGKTEVGDKAYVSYTVKNRNGNGKTEYVTNELVTVGNHGTSSLSAFIAEKEIGKEINGKLIINSGFDVEYSDVIVDWVAGDLDDITERAAGSVTFIPFDTDESVTLVDSASVECAVNGLEFTYYIFPTYYIDIPEYSAEIVIDKLLRENITAEAIYNVIFKGGEKTADYSSGDLTVDDLALKIAKSDGSERAAYIRTLLSITDENGEALGNVIHKNYKAIVYDNLQSAYNEEIRTNLAREIKNLIDKHATLSGDTPSIIVNAIFGKYYNEYKKTFDDSKTSANDYENYYNLYRGDFNRYLIDSVVTDYAVHCEALEEAISVLMKAATDEATELIKIYAVAIAYGQKITDTDYAEYRSDLTEYYATHVFYYKDFDLDEFLGATNMELACQFDKLMNHLLSYKEIKGETDSNGYTMITYEYNGELIKYSFGTPEETPANTNGRVPKWKSVTEFSEIFK